MYHNSHSLLIDMTKDAQELMEEREAEASRCSWCPTLCF